MQSPLPLAPVHEALAPCHPIVRDWFAQTLGEPTEPQIRGWPLIREGKNVLIAAPTGSGKTLTAFLACLDELFKEASEGRLADATQVLYVSPLKALGNDVQKNLLLPLEQLKARAQAAGLEVPNVRVMVRSGDTPAAERAAMVKKPPHILITTPESLYLYLTSARSRETLRSVKTVVVDEIHALARDKRGSHFALSMERLKQLIGAPVQLIGLSATTRPLERLADFLVGGRASTPLGESGGPRVEIVQVGHVRPWQLWIETPQDELTAAPTHEMWGQLYDRVAELSKTHRTMLVFSNTRRLAERVAHDLGERLGEQNVAAHHGSMSRELRLRAEERLKSGQLKVMVATASLELGLDVGTIDLVVQLGSPRSIAAMLQRLGRAGHHKAAISKGVLFAMTRDELVECTALVSAIHRGFLDAVRMPEKPLDVLAQQVVAEVAAKEWKEEELFEVFKRARPYADLTREEYEKVLNLLSEGVSTTRGRSRVHLHRDRVNGILRPRAGARLMALQNGGAIPDLFSYAVRAEPENKIVGSVDEDFAIDSMAGDVFVLGTTSWRIRRVSGGEVLVENAHGVPPSIPFWNGEAPARTDELSAEVSRVREEVLRRDDALKWLTEELGVPAYAADLTVRYIKAGAAALTAVPSQHTVVAERFFDDAGGMQLLIHAPFGARINRAWGMSLRKSFCRAFDFELQAAASDDGILLSLSEQHSFPLMDIFDFVSPKTAEKVLTQAVLQAPMFGTRFRWAAGRALALSRTQNGKKVPPQLQRMRAEDLIAAVFPEQVGCQDNHGGVELEPPDHPLVDETMKDCLRDLMDIDGLVEVLGKLKTGEIRKVAVDLPEPSVFSHALLNSAPYTFLDEAPLEERRARSVSLRRTLPPADAVAFGALDQAAIDQVIAEAAPDYRDEEEFHDTLLALTILPLPGAPRSPRAESRGADRVLDSARTERDLLAILRRAGRASEHEHLAYAAERVPHLQALFPDAKLALAPLPGDLLVDRETAARQVVRGWMEILGPITVPELMSRLGLTKYDVESSLAKLEQQGQVLRGTFRPTATPGDVEWCDRRLLQRIHRLTVGRLRREIEPLSPQDLMRFLFRWQHVDAESRLRGPTGLAKIVSQLQGWEAPAAAWELELFPARIKHYTGEFLEAACFSGDVAWGRLTLKEPKPLPSPRRGQEVPPAEPARRSSVQGRAASLSFTRRADLEWLLQAARPGELLADGPRPWPTDLSHAAMDVLKVFERRGASFFSELQSGARRLPVEVEDALWELLSRGLITADAVQNLRVLQSPKLRKRQRALQRGGPGRWFLLQPHEPLESGVLEEKLAWQFLQRYGIVFRDLVVREPLAPPWRDLLQLYRRFEARGEVRGGRFLHGFSGEQFALPEALDIARAVRRAPKNGEVVRLAAVDPLNLTGVVTPGTRVPSQLGRSVVYVDGVPQSDEATELPLPRGGEGWGEG